MKDLVVEQKGFYVPEKIADGSWRWGINTTRNICGLCYVITIRNITPFSLQSGSSPSSCSADDPPPAGSWTAKYVGLMQVALQMAQGNTYASPMDTAWNWLTNVQIADDIFSQKLGYIGVIEKNAMNSHPGLQALDGYDAENMALLQYGGFASPTLPSVQYYVVLKVSGIWEWVQNSHASTKGQAYVTKVRNATRPQIQPRATEGMENRDEEVNIANSAFGHMLYIFG